LLISRFQSYGVDSVTAVKRSLAVISQEMQTQAAMLAYLDIFFVLMVGCFVAAGLTPFLKKIKLGKAAAH
jgi:hypothetical protein